MKAQWMDEGGVVVRGTDDPRKARTAALGELMRHHVEENTFGGKCYVSADEWLETALHYARWLRDSRVDENRCWRWVPCLPNACYDWGGHKGHLHPATGSRGSWTGVYWWGWV